MAKALKHKERHGSSSFEETLVFSERVFAGEGENTTQRGKLTFHKQGTHPRVEEKEA